MAEQVLDTFTTKFRADTDQASVSRTRRAFEGIRQGLNRLALQMGIAGTAITAAAAGFIRSFANIQTEYAKIEGLVGINAATIRDKFAPAIDALAVSTGVLPQKLAEGLFFVTSAGQRGAEAIQTLTIAARAQAAQLGETNVVADLLTSAMNAYGTENLSAAQAADDLAMGIRLGKLEAQSLAPVMGTLLPVASALGVEFNEIVGLMAAQSRTGTDAAIGVTQLNSVMSDLIKTSEKGSKAIQEKLGMSMDDVRTKIEKDGLLSVLTMLDNAFNSNVEELALVFDNVRALRSVLDLLGENAGTTTDILDAMGDSTGALTEAYEAQTRTINFQFSRAQAAVRVGFNLIGAAMAPVVGDILDKAIPVIRDLSTRFEELPDPVKRAVGWTALLGPIMLVLAAAIPIVTTSVGALVAGVSAIGAPIIAAGVLIGVLAWGIWSLWGPQITDAWESVKETFIDPVIAEIRQKWAGPTWAAIQQAWKGRSLDPIVALVKTFFDSESWETVKTNWNALSLAVLSAVVSPIFDETSWLNIEDSWQAKWLQPIVAGVVALFDPQSWMAVEDWWTDSWLATKIAPVVAWYDSLSWDGVVKWWTDSWLAAKIAPVIAWYDSLSWDGVVKWWTDSWLAAKIAPVVAWYDSLSWDGVVKWWTDSWLATKIAPVVAWYDSLSWDGVVKWWTDSWLAAKIAPVVAWYDSLSWDGVVKWWADSWLVTKIAPVVAWYDALSWDSVVAWWEGLWLAAKIAPVIAWFDSVSWTNVEEKWDALKATFVPIVVSVSVVGLAGVQSFWDSFTSALEKEGFSDKANELAASLVNLGNSLSDLFTNVGVSLSGDHTSGLDATISFMDSLGASLGGYFAKEIVETADALTMLANALAWFIDNAGVSLDSYIAFFQAIGSDPSVQPGQTGAERNRRERVDSDTGEGMDEYETVTGFAGHGFRLRNWRNRINDEIEARIGKTYADAVDEGFWSMIRSTPTAATVMLDDAFGGIDDNSQEVTSGTFPGQNTQPEKQAPWWTRWFNIPGQAEGGVAMHPALRWIGEGEHPEAIVPLNQFEQVISSYLGIPSLGALAAAGAGGGGNSYTLNQTTTVTVPAHVTDPGEIARAVAEENAKQWKDLVDDTDGEVIA